MARGAILLVLIVSLSACAREWPRWRGPDGSAVCDDSPLPVSWSGTEGVEWKASIPGEGSSSPIVWGDALFVTSSLEGGTRRILHCLDRRSGASRWSCETKDPDPERSSALTGHAAATPVTDGTRVIAFFGNAGAVCADFAGEVLWRRRLGEFDSELGLASSPILHRGLVILVCDHDGDRFRTFDSFLIALDARTGETVWKTARAGLFRSWSTPIVSAGELIVAAQDEVRAYDPATGRLLWSARETTGWVAPSPVAGSGLVFAASGKDGPTVAIRPGGEVVWRVARGGPYVCSPVVYGGLLYVCDDQGILVCREAGSGKEVYKVRLQGKFSASPVAGDGKVYFTNEAGTTTVVQAGVEFVVLAENRLEEEVLASPAISRGALLIRAGKRLYCIGK